MVRISELKESNIKTVRGCFSNGQIWVKSDLAESTGMSLAAITNILQFLIKNDEILFVGYAQSSVGRKAKKYQINPDYKHYGVITCKNEGDHDTMNISRYSLLGEEIDTKTLGVNITKDEIVSSAKQIVQGDPKVDVIIIYVPGICRGGRVESSSIRGLVGLNLLNYLKDQIDCQIILDNGLHYAAKGFDASAKGHISVFVYQDTDALSRSVIVYDGDIACGATDYAGTLLNDEQGDAFMRLKHQLATINALLDPDVIGVYSEALDGFDERDLLTDISIYHRAKIKAVDDIDEFIRQGMHAICLKYLLNND